MPKMKLVLSHEPEKLKIVIFFLNKGWQPQVAFNEPRVFPH